MSCVWGTAPDKYLKEAEKVIRSLARLVLGRRKYDSVANSVKTDLEWFMPKNMYIYRTLCMMFKLVRLNNVPFFEGYFSKVCERHDHSTRNSNYNYVSSFNPYSEFAKNSFNYSATTLWNNVVNLQPELKQVQNFIVFKRKLKTRLLELQ